MLSVKIRYWLYIQEAWNELLEFQPKDKQSDKANTLCLLLDRTPNELLK